jgi:hypothetical protein
MELESNRIKNFRRRISRRSLWSDRSLVKSPQYLLPLLGISGGILGGAIAGLQVELLEVLEMRLCLVKTLVKE